MQFVKHIHVLHLLSTIPIPLVELKLRTDNRVYGHGPHVIYVHKPAMTTQEANDAWDHLFTYIFAHWGEPQTAMKEDQTHFYVTAAGRTEVVDCQAMLRMKADELTAKLESLPPYFTESVFPVAVARYLLRELNIPMNHRQTMTFRDFHRRYGTMILSGY